MRAKSALGARFDNPARVCIGHAKRWGGGCAAAHPCCNTGRRAGKHHIKLRGCLEHCAHQHWNSGLDGCICACRQLDPPSPSRSPSRSPAPVDSPAAISHQPPPPLPSNTSRLTRCHLIPAPTGSHTPNPSQPHVRCTACATNSKLPWTPCCCFDLAHSFVSLCCG